VGLWGSLNHTKLARFLCNKHSLKSLYVESCNLGNVGIDAIARGIRINPQLQALHAQYNDITSVTELVSMLSETSCLEKLDLSRNYLGNTRTAVLFAALPNTKSLKTLELYDCGIGDGGLHSIAETLPQTGLTSIVLGRNRIGDSGAIALGKVLPKMSLKSISLDGNRIGHQGVRALLAGVELSTTIESFSGLPAAFGVGQMKVAFHTSQNRSEWKSFLTQDNMIDDDWVSGVQAMGNNGGLSAAFAALQARPDFVFQRADVIV
jgi:Ran GTPase-activating protein (RanGAP) involved in mRNA processing and transport